MINNYTSWQVLDALKRQGYSPQQAQAMYEAMEGERKNSAQVSAGYRAVGAKNATLPSGDDGEQDSGLIPNLAEGTAFGLSGAYLGKKLAPVASQTGRNALRWLGRGVGPLAAATAATQAAVSLDDNNFYDRATAPQLVADMAGSYGGAVGGSALGTALAGKLGSDLTARAAATGVGKGAASLLGRAAATELGGAVAGRVAGALGGRAAGAAVGSAIMPGVGTVLGSALGGWLLPKLLPSGSKSVDEDNGKESSDKQGWATLGALGVGAGLLAHKGTRAVLKDVIKRKKKNLFDEPLSADIEA